MNPPHGRCVVPTARLDDGVPETPESGGVQPWDSRAAASTVSQAVGASPKVACAARLVVSQCSRGRQGSANPTAHLDQIAGHLPRGRRHADPQPDLEVAGAGGHQRLRAGLPPSAASTAPTCATASSPDDHDRARDQTSTDPGAPPRHGGDPGGSSGSSIRQCISAYSSAESNAHQPPHRPVTNPFRTSPSAITCVL